MKNYVIQCTNNTTGVVNEIKFMADTPETGKLMMRLFVALDQGLLPPLPLTYDN